MHTTTTHDTKFNSADQAQFITVVSGLPRSGTSMMMQMLHAGGHPCLTDERRTADADNPRGYFEYEKVKQLRTDCSWLPEAEGKAVKIIAQLLSPLPTELDYRIIFMRRELDEVIASQNRMLARQGRGGGALSDERLCEIFDQQLRQIEKLLADRNIPTLYVPHRAVIEEPTTIAQQVKEFLGLDLDLSAMVRVVDGDLYRQRQERPVR